MKLFKNLFKTATERELDTLVSAYRSQLERGDRITREEFIANYPFMAINLAAALNADRDITALEAKVQQRWPGVSTSDKIIDIDDDEIECVPVDTIKSLGMQIDDYEVIKELGRGAMGRVYKAYQKSLDRHVAIKTLQPGLSVNQSQMKRLSREAKAQGGLKHPNIVELFDIGSVDGVPYLVMELIEGGTSLDTVISAKERPYDEKTSARLILDLAHALAYAHQQEIVHRDIKPANIMMADGTPKLTDFGLAFVGGVDVSRLTQSGELLGTLCYMAPEQVGGRENPERYTRPSPQVDVYALGATLYELLTGHLPFEAATPGELVKQIIDDDPPAPHKFGVKLDKNIEAVCIKCIEKSPEKRYYSTSELADDLQRYLNGVTVNAPRINWTTRRMRMALRQRGAVAGIVAVVAVVFVLWLTSFFSYRDNLTTLVENFGEIPDGGREYRQAFLFKALDEDETDARLSAIVALTRFDDDEARAVVIAAARDPEPAVRSKVLSSMEVAAPATAEAVCKVLLGDENGAVVGGAILLAEKLGIETFMPVLRELAADTKKMNRKRALPIVLEHLGDDNGDFVRTYFQSGPEDGKLEILQWLEKSRYPPPVNALIDSLMLSPSTAVAGRISDVLTFFTGETFGADAVQWRQWRQEHGDRWSIRRCLIFPWIPLGAPVLQGDTAWLIDGRPVGPEAALRNWRAATITVVRGGDLVEVPDVFPLPEYQYVYIGSLDGAPVGTNPIAEKINAALNRVAE